MNGYHSIKKKALKSKKLLNQITMAYFEFKYY